MYTQIKWGEKRPKKLNISIPSSYESDEDSQASSSLEDIRKLVVQEIYTFDYCYHVDVGEDADEYSQASSSLEDIRKLVVQEIYTFDYCYHVDVGEDEDENRLCIDDLQNVFSLLINATNDWFELGLALGIKHITLVGIGSNKSSDKARLREMLAHWLKSSRSRTWRDIFNGLRSNTVQQDVLADTIDSEGKHKGPVFMCPFL